MEDKEDKKEKKYELEIDIEKETKIEKNGKKIINNSTLGISQNNLHQIYGEATSQSIHAYSGIRVDKFGNEILHQGRNLKDISNYKVNVKYEQINIKQQSGFSAELGEEFRFNKEAIINGKTIRMRTTDGLGKTNDTQYDHVIVNSKGKIIENSGTQMKFLKSDSEHYKVIDKLANQDDWSRYDTEITIPKEDYEGAMNYADKLYEKNMQLSKKASEKGKILESKKYKIKAKKYKEAKDKIKPAKLTQKEALNARIRPKQFVFKEVVTDINTSGIVASKQGMKVGGIISIAQNIYEVAQNKKNIDEAFIDSLSSTLEIGAKSYALGVAGTSLKTMMHSSKKQLIRKMGATSLPTMIVTGIVEVGTSFKRYANGEIDNLGLMEELGEKGVGMITAGYCAGSGAVIGATIGSTVPVIGTAIGAVTGGFIGSILGYNISGVIYNGAIEALKEEKISHERRLIIEELARQAKAESEKYRKIFLEFSEKQLKNRKDIIETNLKMLNQSIMDNNIENLFNAINNISVIFGQNLKFKTMEEFDRFMSDKETILEL